MELLSIKTKISQLKTTIITAMETIMKALSSLHDTHQQPMSCPMETKVEDNMQSEPSNDHTTSHAHHIDLPKIIRELKHNIATITNKTRAMFKQYAPIQLKTNTNASSAT